LFSEKERNITGCGVVYQADSHLKQLQQIEYNKVKLGKPAGGGSH
jgi:hypothetical protein